MSRGGVMTGQTIFVHGAVIWLSPLSLHGPFYPEHIESL